MRHYGEMWNQSKKSKQLKHIYQNGPVGSNHGNLQNTPLLALGYRALRKLPWCTVRGYGERGLNTGGDGTDNGGDNGEEGPERTASGNDGVGSEAG